MFQKKTITFLASSVPPRMACGQARRTADVALPPLLPIVEAEGHWIVRHVAGWRGPSMLSLTLSFLREAEKDVVCGGAHLLVFSLDSHSYWGGERKEWQNFCVASGDISPWSNMNIIKKNVFVLYAYGGKNKVYCFLRTPIATLIPPAIRCFTENYTPLIWRTQSIMSGWTCKNSQVSWPCLARILILLIAVSSMRDC